MEKDLAQDHKPLVGLANDIEAHLRLRPLRQPAGSAQTSVRITLKPLAIEVNRPQPTPCP